MKVSNTPSKGWKTVALGDVGEILSGGTPDTTNPKFWSGAIYWCTPTDITALEGKKYIHDSARKITPSGLKNSSAVELPINSIIVCTRATIGDVAINSVPMATNQGFKSIVPKNIDTEFLYYVILWIKPVLKRLGNGSTFFEVSKSDFEGLLISIPQKLSEQKKIALILSTWDRAIEKTEQLIAQKQLLKKGLMQQLMTGKVRFREFVKSKKMRKTKFGMVPVDWELIEFSEVVELSKKKHNPQLHPKSFKCVELEHIDQNTGALLGFTNSVGQKSIKSVFKKGDVLFGKLRPYLRKFWYAEFDGVCSTEIWVMRGKRDRCTSKFIFNLVQLNVFAQIVNLTSGTKMPRADWELVSEFPFPIPSVKEQLCIEQLFSSLTGEIRSLDVVLLKLKVEKTGLMQHILTGKARVRT